MKETVTCAGIFEALLEIISEMKFDFSKLICISTDDTTETAGHKNYFVTLQLESRKPWNNT